MRMKKGMFWCANLCAAIVMLVCGQANGDLIAHLTFDNADTVGTTANDVSGNGVNGLIGAGVTTGVAGMAGEAYSFLDSSADADAVLISTLNATSVASAVAASGQVTISAWVSSTDTANGRNTAVSLVDDSATNAYIDLGIVGDGQANGNGTVNGRTRNGSPQEAFSPALVTVNDGTFHHLALTVDVSSAGSELLSLYVDGALADTLDNTDGLTSANFPAIDRIDIGRLGRGGGQSQAGPYGGLIDDVQIYDEALSAGSIAFLHTNPGVAVPEPSAVFLLGTGLVGLCIKRRRSV